MVMGVNKLLETSNPKAHEKRTQARKKIEKKKQQTNRDNKKTKTSKTWFIEA